MLGEQGPDQEPAGAQSREVPQALEFVRMTKSRLWKRIVCQIGDYSGQIFAADPEFCLRDAVLMVPVGCRFGRVFAPLPRKPCRKGRKVLYEALLIRRRSSRATALLSLSDALGPSCRCRVAAATRRTRKDAGRVGQHLNATASQPGPPCRGFVRPGLKGRSLAGTRFVF